MSELQRYNELNLARWGWRWHLNGGSSLWKAHDLTDRRDDAARMRWWKLQSKLIDARLFVLHLKIERKAFAKRARLTVVK